MRRIRFIPVMICLFLLFIILPNVSADGRADQVLWVGQYYNNTELSGAPNFTRIESDLEFDWGQSSPASSILADNFSARWTATVYLDRGLHRFWIRADDQIRVYVDGVEIINTFNTTTVDQLVSGDISLNPGQHTMTVEYREYVGAAFVFFDFANISRGDTGPDFESTTQQQQQQPTAQTGQWLAQYYPNPTVSGNPVAIIGGQEPRGDWGNAAPLASLPNDEWSARWQTTVALNAGNYIFRATADDGVRVYVNNQLVINEWHTAQDTTYAGVKNLTAGLHTITVDYFESGGRAFLEFDYELYNGQFTPSTPGTVIETPQPQPTVSPRSSLGSVTIATGRLNVRDNPSPFTGQIVTRVSEGDRFEVLEFNSSETWVKINANGTIGWINAGYTVYNAPDFTSNQSEYLVTASPYNVNIRTGPGTQFPEIGTLDDGETATVIGRNVQGTWWEINYRGIVGWVSSFYAKLEARADTSQIPMTER